MKKRFYSTILLTLCLLVVTACGEKTPRDIEYTKDTINSTKLCPKTTYACLTETKDKAWRKKLISTQFEFNSRDLLWIRLNVIEKVFDHYKVDKGIDEKGRDAYGQLRYKKVFEDNKLLHQQYKKLPDGGNKIRTDMALKIAAEFMNKTEDELVADKFYQMTEREERDIKLRRKQRWYIEIAQMMELFFPDFWKDTPQEERIKWVMQAEHLGRKHDPDSSGRGTIEIMAAICGMIGLDFEMKPEHTPIVKYLSTMKEGDWGQLSQTMDYLSFVYLERDYDLSGTHLNNWSMRDALGHLPRPDRHVPRFSEEVPKTGMYLEKHDIWKVYEDTIVDGGKH